MSGAESAEEEVAPPKVCTPELLKEKMSNIGPTFDGTAFAFLTLDLEDAELINLSPELDNYIHLRFVNFNRCNLGNIDNLKKMPHLLSVQAESNELKAMDMFKDEELFTYLQNLNLAYNLIAAFPAFKLPKLLHLNLRGNQIGSLEAFEGLANLKTLNLKGNQVTSLSGLHEMPNLEKIDLSKNLIQSIVGFTNVPKLRDIKLRQNNIEKFEENEELPILPDLQVLNL